MPSRARATVQPISALTAAEWDEVRAFGGRFFEGDFAASLRTKHELVLLRDEQDAIVGMGGVEIFALAHAGRTATFIHLGNTAFTDELRGQRRVQRLGFGYFLRAKARHPLRPVYLVYTTFSWRSYLMLCRNFARSWPRAGQTLPAWEAAIYDQLGRRLLGERWDPATGTARNLDRRLRPEIARIPETLADDPDVRFFAAANPGYLSGDALLCLAPLDLRNWTRVLERALVARRKPPASAEKLDSSRERSSPQRR